MQAPTLTHHIVRNRILSLIRPLAYLFLAILLPTIPVQAQGTDQVTIQGGVELLPADTGTASLDQAANSGAKWVRASLDWEEIEPTPGNYNWTAVDALVNGLESRGLSAVLTIAGNNHIYEDVWDEAIVTQAGRDAFAAFAADLATRYSGKDIVWEIWNQPNRKATWHVPPEGGNSTDSMADEYAALVNTVVPAMKAVDPDCRVVAGSLSDMSSLTLGWLDRCIQSGMLASGIDGISVHPYQIDWPELAELDGYAALRQLLDANSATPLGIINTEITYPEARLIHRGIPAAQVAEAQAWLYVRQNLADVMSGLELTIWHSLAEDTQGMYNADLSTRPVAQAAQVMAQELDGFFIRQRIALPSPLDYAVVLENAAGDLKMAVWTTSDSKEDFGQQAPVPHTAAIPIGAAGSYTVTDTFGNTSSLSTGDDHLDVPLGGGPVYIPLTADPATTYRNVALHQPATVNSGSGEDKLTDGITADNSSRWLSGPELPQTATVDLGGAHMIDTVILRQQINRVDDFEVQVWDGSAWVTVASGTGNTDNDISVTFPQVQTEYVQFVVTDSSNYLKVYELEAYGYGVPSGGTGGGDVEAPSVPTGLAASAVSANQIDLSWNASTDNLGVAGYVIYRDGTQVATSTVASFSDLDLDADTAYSYEVAAYDAAGNTSANSAAASATTSAPAGEVNLAAGKLSSVSSSNGSYNGLNLTDGITDESSSRWLAEYGYPQDAVIELGEEQTVSRVVVHQQVNRAYDYTINVWDGSGWVSVASVTDNTEKLLDVSFDPVTTSRVQFMVTDGNLYLKIYEIEVFGQPGGGGGDTEAPSVPTGLTATAASSSQIQLSWTAATDNVAVTGYEIYRDGVLQDTVAGESYTDNGLAAGTAYSYEVAAFDAAGNTSARSTAASATTDTGGGTPGDGAFTNLAFNQPVTVSDGESTAHKLTDGVFGTSNRWVGTNAYPQNAIVDLAEASTISRVILTQHVQGIEAYTVEVWTGSSWVEVAADTNNTAEQIDVSFPPIVAERVRFTAEEGNGRLRVYEMTVFGYAGAGAPPPTPAPARLFILTGQSNMKNLHPEESFTPRIQALYPGEEVIVVHHAISGQPIRRWYEDWVLMGDEATGGVADIYAELMLMIESELVGKQAPKSVSYIWMQGEADTNFTDSANAYQGRFEGLIQQVRDDFGQDTTFVVGRLSDFELGEPDWMTVRNALQTVATADPLGGWIDTDDLNGNNDDLHYSSQGYITLGERFADKIKDVIDQAESE